MAIQYISYLKKNYTNFVCSTFKHFDQIDKYDLTIVDFGEHDLWVFTPGMTLRTIVDEEILKLNEAILNSKNGNVLYLLPQDLKIANPHVQGKSVNLSFYLLDFKNKLFVNSNLKDLKEICVVDDETSLKNGAKLKSSFFFKCSSNAYDALTLSDYSEHKTTIKNAFNHYIYTFLDIDNEEKLLDFLETIGISVSHSILPQWLLDLDWFNDKDLKEEIFANQKIIQTSNEKISENRKMLDVNNQYKSMLVSQGDELVKSVFMTLEEILEIDTQSFIDEKVQDLDFVINDVTYLVEIKGVAGNVKNENITQLIAHESRFTDSLNEKGITQPPIIKKVLIINHQRQKKIEDRLAINKQQIDLAIKYDVLVIETITLLRVLESFRKGALSKDDILNLFTAKTGLLKL